MAYKCRIVYIQRFYKRRFRQRMLSCQLIQRYAKGFTVFKRWQVLLRIARAA
jgi:hypothetical protein